MILDPENDELLKSMQEICEYFIEMNAPQDFNPRSRKNIIVGHDKSFESICANMQESGFNPYALTIFEFYARIEHFETKYEKLKAHGTDKSL